MGKLPTKISDDLVVSLDDTIFGDPVLHAPGDECLPYLFEITQLALEDIGPVVSNNPGFCDLEVGNIVSTLVVPSVGAW